MKFTINRNLFLDNVTNVMRAISSRTTIPILTGIKLDLTNDYLEMTGSDADISIKIHLNQSDDFSIDNPGSIVLQARFFSEIIKKLPGKEFTLEVLDNFQTIITSENSEFTLNGLDADNYPHLPEISSDTTFNISGEILKDVISETTFAVATQESRPILTGVHFTFESDSLKAVATDSHRLSQREVTIENGPEGLEPIIPGRSLTELSRIIDTVKTDVVVKVTENQALFEVGNILFYTRLLEGNYPDTNRLLPDSSTTNVTFDIPTLSSALDRASLLTHESRNNVVKLSINPANNSVIINGNSPEVGNVEEKIDFKAIDGEELEISFNPDYLRDALKASITSDVIMSFTQALRPFTVNPNDSTIKFIQLITPVRTF